MRIILILNYPIKSNLLNMLYIHCHMYNYYNILGKIVVWGEYSNTDTLTINHHNFIISQLNISTFYLYVFSR